MYLYKKDYLKLSHKKLVDLIFSFQWRIYNKDRWGSYMYRMFGRSPSAVDIVEEEMKNMMMGGNISAEEYKGGLKFIQLLEKELKEEYEERIADDEKKLEKVGLLELVKKDE